MMECFGLFCLFSLVNCCLFSCDRLLDEIEESIYTGMDQAARRSQMILEAVGPGKRRTAEALMARRRCSTENY